METTMGVPLEGPLRTLLTALLLGLAGTASAGDDVPVEPLDDGHGVLRVLDARPFALDEGTVTYDFRAGAPGIRSGHVVIVRARPELVQLRQVRSPVLYAGAVPVQVVARDVASGCIVGLLPPDVDPRTEPFYFGSYELPERVDVARGTAERAAALRLGVGPRPAAERGAWTLSSLRVPDADALVTRARASLQVCTQRASPTDP